MSLAPSKTPISCFQVHSSSNLKPWQVPLPHTNPLWHAPAASQGLSGRGDRALVNGLSVCIVAVPIALGAQHLFLRKTSAYWLLLAHSVHSLNMHKTQLCIHNSGVSLLPGQARWTNAALDARNAQGRLSRWTLSSVWNSGRRSEPVCGNLVLIIRLDSFIL